MKSMFQMSMFGGSGFRSWSPALGQVRLAQDAGTAPTPTPAPATSDTSALTGGIEDLLKQLPSEALGTYSAKYQACQTQLTNGGAVGLVTGGKCLADLYKEIQDFIKNGPKKAPPPPPAAAPDLILPIVVGVLGLGVLIWGLTKL
jgi:hypothetical protein